MRIFIEGAYYDSDLLKRFFRDDIISPKKNSDEGKIDHVGYFHSYNEDQKRKELIYILPKVFIREIKGDPPISYVKLISEKLYSIKELSEEITNNFITEPGDLNWIKKFLIIFYKGLIEYRNRYNDNIQFTEDVLQLNSTLGEKEYSFLDIVIQIGDFYKKNKSFIVFQYKERQSHKHKSVKWVKTTRKTDPFFTKNNEPIYVEVKNKIKKTDPEELLLIIFFSVLYNLKTEYQFYIDFDNSFAKYKGAAFKNLEKKAPRLLKKIRYKYFSDTLTRMHKLLTLYFDKQDTGSIKNRKEDYIMVKSYEKVFENMIDKLYSDDFNIQETKRKISLKKLKNHKDGKQIDHLFKYNGLFDTDESIFYIGDSKYYKTGAEIDENSIYKQFTYAKNVIQFNIDLLNEKKEIERITYRDQITEGYNISPNFFIKGLIDTLDNYNAPKLVPITVEKNEEEVNKIEKSYHWPYRLFDRDTLYTHYYSINFLYVLNAYIRRGSSTLLHERNKAKEEFRQNMINYINTESGFTLYSIIYNDQNNLKNWIEPKFKNLVGKCYFTKSSRLIIAIHVNDEKKEELTKYVTELDLKEYTLA